MKGGWCQFCAQLGITRALAFAIGFENIAIEELENDERYLDSLPISVVAEIAIKLNLSLLTLLQFDSKDH